MKKWKYLIESDERLRKLFKERAANPDDSNATDRYRAELNRILTPKLESLLSKCIPKHEHEKSGHESHFTIENVRSYSAEDGLTLTSELDYYLRPKSLGYENKRSAVAANFRLVLHKKFPSSYFDYEIPTLFGKRPVMRTHLKDEFMRYAEKFNKCVHKNGAVIDNFSFQGMRMQEDRKALTVTGYMTYIWYDEEALNLIGK